MHSLHHAFALQCRKVGREFRVMPGGQGRSELIQRVLTHAQRINDASAGVTCGRFESWRGAGNTVSGRSPGRTPRTFPLQRARLASRGPGAAHYCPEIHERQIVVPRVSDRQQPFGCGVELALGAFLRGSLAEA